MSAPAQKAVASLKERQFLFNVSSRFMPPLMSRHSVITRAPDYSPMTMADPSTPADLTHKLQQLLEEASARKLSEVAEHQPGRLLFLLAARFEHDVRAGGFAQLLYNMKGVFLSNVEDMLIAAKAPIAHEYYVQAIRTCLANKPAYASFLASNYTDANPVKDQLHLVSIAYLSRGTPFAIEGKAWLMSANV